ncbi:MAG TPA: hypothetical protein VIG80_13675 [Bacillaceae bacterium]
MKRIKMAFVALLFIFTGAVSAAAAEPASNLEDVQQFVDRANAEIDQEISAAVTEADRLIAVSVEEIGKIEGKDKIARIEAELQELTFLLDSEELNGKEYIKLSEKVDKISEKLQEENLKQEAKVQAVLDKLGKDLDELIENLIQVTNAISAEAVQYGQERGLEVICEYVEVQIGGRTVLIDPLRVGI